MSHNKKNSVNTIPHVFIILFFLILLSSLLTYIIPAGVFERVHNNATGQTIVLANSYTRTQNTPVAPWKIPSKLFEAITSKSTAQLIFFILFIGGSFEIIMQTESMLLFFEKILIQFKDKTIWIIPIFVFLFSILGFTMGFATASVIFVPIGILAARMLNFSKLTGVAMVALGTNAGFAAGIFNPFSVGIAQTIAEVPLFSGAWIRWLLLACLLIATSFYIMYYAKKFDNTEKTDKAEMYELLTDMGKQRKFSVRQKLVLIVFLSAFGIVIYGISSWKWKVADMAVLFLVIGIICGILYGFKLNKLCEIYIAGCRKMMTGVFVIGMASTMRLILSEGQILDTIAYSLTGMVRHLPNWAALMGMFYGNAALDFLITSGSAHAAVAMPIMIPIADYLNISRQSAVFAFQLGDGLVNLCSPLSTTLTGILAVSDIPYGKWVKFFFPLVGIYLLIGTAFIGIAGIVGY